MNLFRGKTHIVATVIIIVSTIFMIGSSWNTAITADETAHIGAGYTYLSAQDIRLNIEHPPLFKIVAAAPLQFINLNSDRAYSSEYWANDDQWRFSQVFIYLSGNDADQIKHVARAPMLLFFISSAILLYIWTKKLYGEKASIIALTLFSFSPTVLAHAPLVTSDMVSAWGLLFSSYFYILFVKKPTLTRAIVAGVFLGFALLSKFSLAILLPIFYLIPLIHPAPFKNKKTLLYGGLLFLVSVVGIVLPVYMSISVSPEQAIAAFMGGITYVFGSVSDGIKPTFLLGEIYPQGTWYYFPVVYFFKESIFWWLLVCVAGAAMFLNLKNRGSFSNKIIDEKFFWIWILIYGAATLTSDLNIGIRHLLPLYPFFLMFAAKWLTKNSFKFQNVAVPVLVICYVASSILAYPHYINYTNLFVPKAKAYTYFVDSNIDWGQDLITFSEWVHKNDIKKIEFDYFGSSEPYYYLGSRYEHVRSDKYSSVEDFKARNTSDGWLAVSVTNLQLSPFILFSNHSFRPYPWLKEVEPFTTINNTIFIYHIK